MFNLITGHKPDDLMVCLAATIQARRLSVFDTVHIIAPNATFEAYLKLELARHLPIVANIRFARLEGYFEEIRSGLHGDTQILTAESLTSIILDVLAQDEAQNDPDLRPIFDYIQAPHSSPQARDSRAYQLASRVAGYFREYTYSRPEMIRAWFTNTHTFVGHGADIVEAWQQALWTRIFAPDGTCIANGQKHAFLPALFEKIADAELGKKLPKNLFILGFPILGNAFQTILKRLSHLTDVHVFVQDPCGLDDAATNYWGTLGMEGFQALKNLSDDTKSVTSTRVVPVFDNPLDALRIYQCTGIQREIEVIANTIWDLTLRDDDPPRLSEIGIAVGGNMDAYLAQIEAVFKVHHDLPYSVAGYRPVAESPVISACRALLELPESTFTRSDVLRVLLHPNVRVKCPNANPNSWLEWCDAANIRHGYSRDDLADTYITEDIYNWDQGLYRLALGGFLSQPVDQESHSPIQADDTVEVAGFHVFARSLLSDSRWLVAQSMTIPEWMEVIRVYIDTYIGADYTQPKTEDYGVIARISRALATLADGTNAVRNVSYHIIKDMVLAEIENLIFTTERVLVQGLTVGTPSELSGIPFKHVFFVGMNEGVFPGTDLNEPLDLRTQHCHLGDVTTNAKDRYAFFQLLTAAKDAVHISYLARDPFSGEPAEPASVVSEMLSMISGEILQKITEKHPLRRYDGREGIFAKNQLHEAYREAFLDEHGDSLRRHFAAANLPLPSQIKIRKFIESAEDPAVKSIARHLRYPVVDPFAYTDERRVIQVKMSALAKFLKTPLQGTAQHHIGFLTDEQAIDAQDQEAFDTAVYSQTVLLRNVFMSAIPTSLTSTDLAFALEQGLQAQPDVDGRLPQGIFRARPTKALQKVLTTWAAHFEKWFKHTPQTSYTRYAIGLEPSERDTAITPLSIDVQDPHGKVVEVRIVGHSSLLAKDFGAFVGFTHKTHKAEHAIEGYVSYLVLTAHPDVNLKLHNDDPKAMTGVRVVPNDLPKPNANQTTGVYPLAAITTDEAQAILRNILTTVLYPEDVHIMPLDSLKFGTEEFEETEGDYGPIRDYSNYTLPQDIDAYRDAYFAPFSHLYTPKKKKT